MQWYDHLSLSPSPSLFLWFYSLSFVTPCSLICRDITMGNGSLHMQVDLSFSSPTCLHHIPALLSSSSLPPLPLSLLLFLLLFLLSYTFLAIPIHEEYERLGGLANIDISKMMVSDDQVKR